MIGEGLAEAPHRVVLRRAEWDAARLAGWIDHLREDEGREPTLPQVARRFKWTRHHAERMEALALTLGVLKAPVRRQRDDANWPPGGAGVLELRGLPHGWDGRRANSPTNMALRAATKMLLAVTTAVTPPPQIFPLPDGGLQLEWLHRASVSIEVDREGSCHVLTTDEAGSVVINDEVGLGDKAVITRVRLVIHDLFKRKRSAGSSSHENILAVAQAIVALYDAAEVGPVGNVATLDP